MNTEDPRQRTAAVILCAGQGKRFGGKKQFRYLRDRPLWEWSAQVFQDSPDIHEIILVVPPEDVHWIRRVTADRFNKIRLVTPGGSTRLESSYNGLLGIGRDIKWVLIHDGARPFVTQADISNVLKAASVCGAAVPVISVKDTVKNLTAGGFVDKTVCRESLGLAQTPQAFSLDIITNSYNRVLRNQSGSEALGEFTDDSSVVEFAGYKVISVPGAESNFKITTPDDWTRGMIVSGALSAMASNLSPYRVGVGYDAHRLASGRKLVLGGVHVPYHLGLQGHSDADVLTHALMDALLGAVGERDIGYYFPCDDERFTDAFSLDLLKRVVQIISYKGFVVNSVDAVIVAEEPKISSFVTEIRHSLSSVLGVSPDRVGVKGSTNEGMGFVGRGEGVSCLAVATVISNMG